MGKLFQHFVADDSQYIMIFWILQQRGGMLVVLGGHLVNIGDGYWWFKLINFILKYYYFLSLKSALIYFQATESIVILPRQLF